MEYDGDETNGVLEQCPHDVHEMWIAHGHGKSEGEPQSGAIERIGENQSELPRQPSVHQQHDDDGVRHCLG